MKKNQFQKQTTILIPYLMNYLEEHDIPNINNKITFQEIGYPSDVTLFGFLNSKLFHSFQLLEQECIKYKEVYPKAYQKLQTKIEKRKTYLNCNQKLAIFLEYIEDNEIPTAYSEFRFCDINPNTKNTCRVGIWLQEQVAYDVNKFFDKCEKYQEQYPKAYQKMRIRLARKLELDLESTRLKMVIDFFEKNPQTCLFEKIRFCEISPDCVDNIYMSSWLKYQISSNLSNLKLYLLPYKNSHPKAYQKISEKIKQIENYSPNQALSFERRFELIVKYFEENIDMDFYAIRFEDLDPNCQDKTMICSWLANRLENNLEKIIIELEKYKEIYPKAYDKLHYRILHKKNHGYDPLYSKKLELFMRFACTNDIRYLNEMTFSELDPSCNISTNIIYWFRNQIYSNKQLNIDKFMEEIKKYKDIYPSGYLQITTYLNNSEKFLSKERTARLNVLKNLRTELINKEDLTSIQKLSLTKQKRKI